MKDNILLIGSSCVGKTSVLDLLKEDPSFSQYEIIPSIARQVRQREQISSFDDISLQKRLFDAYRLGLNVSTTGKFVFDRSIIDVYTFTQTIKDNSEDFCVLLSDMRDAISEEKDKLGRIFYFPIYWDVEDDGERLIDSKRREQWDKNIQILLKDEQIPYYTIPYCDPKERVAFIKSIVKS